MRQDESLEITFVTEDAEYRLLDSKGKRYTFSPGNEQIDGIMEHLDILGIEASKNSYGGPDGVKKTLCTKQDGYEFCHTGDYKLRVRQDGASKTEIEKWQKSLE